MTVFFGGAAGACYLSNADWLWRSEVFCLELGLIVYYYEE